MLSQTAPANYLKDLLVFAFVDGPSLCSPSTLKHRWQPMFERFLIRLYSRVGHPVPVPNQQQLLKDHGIRNVFGVLRSIAPDFSSTASTRPMFPHDARRLCSVVGFGSRDRCDKFAIWMLCSYGLRFVDLQRYQFKDFRMDSNPPMLQLMSWKNGTALYSLVRLKDEVARYAREYFSCARLEANDRVFQYAMVTAENKEEVMDSVAYFESGRTNFASVLNAIGCRAGYPDGFFTPHSGASGFVTHEVLKAFCNGQSYRDTLDRVCVETGRWMVGSTAILRYVSSHVARIGSLLNGATGPVRLAEYKMLSTQSLHNIATSPMCRKLCNTACFGDKLRVCSTMAEILGDPVEAVMQGDSALFASRVATLMMRGHNVQQKLSARDTRSLAAEGKFIHWIRREMPENLIQRSIRGQVRSIVRQAITPLILLSLLSPSPTQDKPVVVWPLPAHLRTYLLLPCHQYVIGTHGQLGGTYLDVPEVRGNENSLIRRNVPANGGQGLMASYMSKRARVTKAIIVEGGGSPHVRVPRKYQPSFRLKQLQARPLDTESKHSVLPCRKRRRKAVPWSTDEAAALKDYVENKNMLGRWSEILEQERMFSAPRFLPRRTSVDLKVFFVSSSPGWRVN